ncbi:GNAT family N-acetyltransferase [Chloroflexi bacterium TSY]|nr:GNAT family N-acetyltransferase [Chloroflexi bacterium TSY]
MECEFQPTVRGILSSGGRIGGVETLLPFRRRGYVTKLMTKALVGMSQRVNIAFISEGIDHLYEKFGFATCLTEAHISLKVRTVMEQQADPTGRDAQNKYVHMRQMICLSSLRSTMRRMLIDPGPMYDPRIGID